ncbi:C39 family peptidase [Patescibacteria group bacterium]
MKKILYIHIIASLVMIMSTGFIYAKIMTDTDLDGLSDTEEINTYITNPHNQDTDLDDFPDAMEIYYGYSPLKGNAAELEKISLDLPYIHESPDGSWTGPWKNGCEEASIFMIENFYIGKNDPSIKESMNFMMALFNKQDQIWGSNADSDAYRTNKLINDFTKYNSTIIDNPTIEQIKIELQQKRPVIALHYGKTLANPNIPFAANGSYYHMTVIIGYDEPNQEFIVHDNGDPKTGDAHRYKYSVFMESLHDFDFATRKADGPARVIFTYPKLVKLMTSPKVYFLQNKTKQWIINEQVFNTNAWDWDAINIVRPEWLINFTNGLNIIEDLKDKKRPITSM